MPGALPGSSGVGLWPTFDFLDRHSTDGIGPTLGYQLVATVSEVWEEMSRRMNCIRTDRRLILLSVHFTLSG